MSPTSILMSVLPQNGHGKSPTSGMSSSLIPRVYHIVTRVALTHPTTSARMTTVTAKSATQSARSTIHPLGVISATGRGVLPSGNILSLNPPPRQVAPLLLALDSHEPQVSIATKRGHARGP